MKTGQASMHAAQVVHCQSELGEVAGTVPIISNCELRIADWSELLLDSFASYPNLLATNLSFRNSKFEIRNSVCIRSRSWRMMSRGESSLPTVFAGQTAVQRPHSVQASRSSRSFHVKPLSELTPKLSVFSKSICLSVAPSGTRLAV